MNGSMITEEHEIIKRCLNGDADQYAVLVDSYSAMAFNVAYRMLGNASIAKNLAQDSFISAYTALENFKFDSKFSSWLYRIVVNKCRDHLKTQKETVSVDEIAWLVPSQAQTPEQALSSRETGDMIQKALRALPVDQREVIVLKHVEGLDSGEIEDILSVGVNALKVRAHRGREKLKELLEGMGVTR
jgi:RNA polymerase sigma-70 factor (ECF subfamily)